MSVDEYQMRQKQIYLIARLVHDMDWLGEHVNSQSRADTLGPILDPTAWMHNHKKLDQDHEIAAALLKLQDAIHNLGVFKQQESD